MAQPRCWYWVHIEPVYGRRLWYWKGNLSVSQTVAAAIALILMLMLSAAKTCRRPIGAAISQMGWWAGPQAGEGARGISEACNSTLC